MYENEIKKIAHSEAMRFYMKNGYSAKQAEKMADWLIYKK